MNIGIFWFYKDEVIGIAHEFSLHEADSIGLIDSQYAHMDYWEKLKLQIPGLEHTEYEQLPRGRVIFNTHKGKAIIYLDKTLLQRSKVNQILNFFNLNVENVILRTDPHYKI